MAKTHCTLCDGKLTNDEELAMEACGDCATRIGIIPMPPSRRPPRPCARCNSLQFVRVIPREHTSARSGETNAQISAPMFVTHAPTSYRGYTDKHVEEVEIEKKGRGLLETYICRTCGAVEWYCLDVERIPIHPHLMSEAIDYAGDGPYR